MAVKKLRVLALMHIGLVPPADATSREEHTEWKTEFDVLSTLRAIGHEVMPLGIYDDLVELEGPNYSKVTPQDRWRFMLLRAGKCQMYL